MNIPIIQKRWQVLPIIDEITDTTLDCYPPFLRQVLYNRGIRTLESAQDYLYAKTPLADPFLLTDMSKAVSRLISAIDRNEPIAIYGDYDVDGVTATAMMVEALRSMGAVVEAYIPNRFDEGYGLNEKAIHELTQRGIKVILTVDCGIRSPREATIAQSLGVDLIISDHHHPKDVLPEGYAVICPKRPDDPYPDKELAGVGVAYKIVQALFQATEKHDRLAEEWLDLVALGTVADIVPLTGENRVMVRRGLQQIRMGKRAGLNALAGVAGKEVQAITAGDIGFILGPRLNAAGRMESALRAYEMLVSDSWELAGRQAQILEDQNRERQQATRLAQEKAQHDLGDISGVYLIGSFDEEYSSGIVGLVASKLVESHYRPAIVGQIEDGYVRASCRSIAEFHITNALDECADLLVRHGGHAMAAGFTVELDKLPEFMEKMHAIATRELAGKDLRPVVRADLELDIEEVDPSFYRDLELLQPVGMGNPGALFISRNVQIDEMRVVGKDRTHINMRLHNSRINQAVAFHQANWFELWRLEKSKFDLAFTLEVNRNFNQDTLQLNVKDMRPSSMID